MVKAATPQMKAESMKGIVLDLLPRQESLFCNFSIDGGSWKLCDKDLDVNYIMHAIKEQTASVNDEKSIESPNDTTVKNE